MENYKELVEESKQTAKGMAEYIEKGEIINRICNEKCRAEYGECKKGRHGDKIILCVCDFIRLQEQADVALVVHGRWVRIYENGEPSIKQHQIGVCCSKCMKIPKDKFTESDYCPNCGAKMDGGEKDGQNRTQINK